MKRTQSFAIAVLLIGSLGLAAATAYSQRGNHGSGYGGGHGGGHGMGHGMGRWMGHGPGHKGNPVRHRIIRHGNGVPSPYANIQNPLKATKANIDAGAKLYVEHCATCHGKSGEGDGSGGKDLNPKPANLAFIMDRWIATDDFLMWSIAEGGEKLKTDMPAFKEVLTENERWQIIRYMTEAL